MRIRFRMGPVQHTVLVSLSRPSVTEIDCERMSVCNSAFISLSVCVCVCVCGSGCLVTDLTALQFECNNASRQLVD